MKSNKIRNLIVSIFATLCIFLTPITSLRANAQYEIVFKAGLHGNIDGNKSTSFKLTAGSIFPDEPVVRVEEGYVFKGWNKELPSVGSTVEGKQVFVAQYDVLVSGVNYMVRYVDEGNVAIATPKASMAEDGSTIVERAKSIPGYTYQQAQQQVTINEKNKTVTFVYTLTNPREVIRYEEEVINQTVDGTNTNANANGNNQNTGNNDNNQGNANGENNNGQDQGNETIPDDQTPKANGNKAEDNTKMIMGASAVALLLVIGGILLVMKKRNAVKE